MNHQRERTDFMKNLVATSVVTANALFDQYLQQKSLSSLHHCPEAVVPHQTCSSGYHADTALVNTVRQPDVSLPTKLLSSPFILPTQDQLLQSPGVGLGVFSPAQPLLSNILCGGMDFAQAEAILTPKLQLEGPHVNQVPAISLRDTLTALSMARSPSPSLRRSSRNSTAAFPQPETRNSSLCSSFSFDLQQQEPSMPSFTPRLDPGESLAIAPYLYSPVSPVKMNESHSQRIQTPSYSISEDSHDVKKSPSPKASSSEKPRTRLTQEQREYMMRIFEVDQNPSSNVMRKVAETVGMRFRLVQYFYQNRRAALRRQKAGQPKTEE